MTTDAQQIDLVLHQHARVRGAVRRVTDHAAFNFRFVLVDEWPLLFGVALVADCIAGSVGAELLRAVTAMGIVAITALQQSFRDAVMEGARELRPNILMAGVAKLGRLRPHEELALFGVMRGVTVDAGHAVGEVHGAVVIAVLFGVLVAAQAARAGLLRSGVFESENLGLIPAAVHMFLAGAVAGFASMPFHAFMRIQLRIHSGSEVRSLLESGIDLVVAGFAGIGANVKRGVGRRHIVDVLRSFVALVGLFVGRYGASKTGEQE